MRPDDLFTTLFLLAHGAFLAGRADPPECHWIASPRQLRCVRCMTRSHHFFGPRQSGIGLAGGFIVVAWSSLAQPKTGDIVFQTDFEGAGTLRAWGEEQIPSVRLAPGFESAPSPFAERMPGAFDETILAVLRNRVAGQELRATRWATPHP